MTDMRLAEIDWRSDRDQIVAAMKFHDVSKEKLETGTKFFIWYRGRAYPPKHVLSIWKQKPRDKFSGGDKTNNYFRDLGFSVVKGTSKLLKYKQSVSAKPQSLGQISEIKHRIDALLSTKWRPLDSKEIDSCPGVYLLAYSGRDLTSKDIELEDIFYVGMSTTSLRKRLRQFRTGLNDGGHHSGAKRFYNDWCGGVQLSKIKTKSRFFLATMSINCEPDKSLRSPADLERLGIVAALEFFVLAKIKAELDLEPPLNKK